MDPEHLLCRLTAQSKAQNPKMPTGGKPDLSFEDIQHASTKVRRLSGYWAVQARICQSKLAEKNLRQAMRRLAILAWHGDRAHRSTNVSTETLEGLADTAVSVYVNPRQKNGNLRSMEWVARQVGVHPNTFHKRYKLFWQRLASYLHQIDGEAQQDIRRATRSMT